ncbi:hypothetical protein [uncultured Roseobacter sp.]|uniref:hypothetical protein n=1 Tax=uncultured Roseobacter sp. TaxID=114847 RepID=UPI0026312887|nr:hypothetical protein [uncultured Roseobacter sp.]
MKLIAVVAFCFLTAVPAGAAPQHPAPPAGASGQVVLPERLDQDLGAPGLLLAHVTAQPAFSVWRVLPGKADSAAPLLNGSDPRVLAARDAAPPLATGGWQPAGFDLERMRALASTLRSVPDDTAIHEVPVPASAQMLAAGLLLMGSWRLSNRGQAGRVRRASAARRRGTNTRRSPMK